MAEQVRLFITETGRRTHIVRERAYQGPTYCSALCGVFTEQNKTWTSECVKSADCKTCTRLFGKEFHRDW